jgi:hypothetical protein
MTQEIINIGAQANDGEGDPLRTAFAKINNNFTQLFATGWATTEAVTLDDTTQSIFSVDATLFTQAQFQINSVNPATNDSQNITLTAAISNDLTTVKFTAHGTLINGDPVVSDYDMDVVDGFVNIYVTPLVDDQVNHFIGYQIMFNDNVVGMSLSLENSSDVLGTEGLVQITTEQPA